MLLTQEGKGAIRNGHGVGTPTPDGGLKFAASVAFQADTTGKLARLERRARAGRAHDSRRRGRAVDANGVEGPALRREYGDPWLHGVATLAIRAAEVPKPCSTLRRWAALHHVQRFLDPLPRDGPHVLSLGRAEQPKVGSR
jgi:hypothetical protein